jgi:glycosyltransferase involved in cell wall biosynthesis
MSSPLINILFVTHADKKGGAEQSLVHLINYIDTSLYRIYLICPGNASYLGEITASFTHIPLSLGSIKKRLGFGYVETVLRIRSLVKKLGIDIVHANGWRAPWYIGPLKFMSPCKRVWHHRDHTHLRMFNRVLPRFFDQVICISKFVAGSIEGSNKKVIYNGVDPRLAIGRRRRGFMDDGQLVIGTFGRIVEWKRYDLVIDAVAKLPASGRHNWKLLIVGDASIDGSDRYYDMLIRKVIEYGLERHVEFCGHTSKPLDKMQECDLTVNFSLNEPFGRVIIESMLVGTPPIVADSGGAPEIIEQTKGGLVVRDGDSAALYEAIRGFYDGEVNYEELAVRGYDGVMDAFHMGAIARKVEHVYQGMLEPAAIRLPGTAG